MCREEPFITMCSETSEVRAVMKNDPFGFVIQLSGSISCSVVGWLHVYLLFLRK